MPKMNSSKFLSQMHFNLKNGKLKFNLEKDNLEKRHCKPDPMFRLGQCSVLDTTNRTYCWELKLLVTINRTRSVPNTFFEIPILNNKFDITVAFFQDSHCCDFRD